MNSKLLPMLVIVAAAAQAQLFSSGSSGADGALELTAPGTMVFDSRAFSPSGDNVFHVTTIHIPKGATVELSSKTLNGPVFWLAQGPVEIAGAIDLNGADGAQNPLVWGCGWLYRWRPAAAKLRPGRVYAERLPGSAGRRLFWRFLIELASNL